VMSRFPLGRWLPNPLPVDRVPKAVRLPNPAALAHFGRPESALTEHLCSVRTSTCCLNGNVVMGHQYPVNALPNRHGALGLLMAVMSGLAIGDQ
jgi:hypothetical protein